MTISPHVEVDKVAARVVADPYEGKALLRVLPDLPCVHPVNLDVDRMPVVMSARFPFVAPEPADDLDPRVEVVPDQVEVPEETVLHVAAIHSPARAPSILEVEGVAVTTLDTSPPVSE